jgi:hypothetical protein
MREELSDIIEELADKLYVYGCDCTSIADDGLCSQGNLYEMCRPCFTTKMKLRLIDVVELQHKLN